MHAAQSLTDERLRALADPVRRNILTLVGQNEAQAGRIAEHFRISRPAVSRHLRVLRAARLVVVREEGTSRYYQADRAALAEMGRWFDNFWDQGLPKLKSLAEKETRDET